MTRDQQAQAYAAMVMGSQLPTADDWIPDHGGPVTGRDVYEWIDAAYVAGWDACAAQIRTDLA